MMLMQQLKQLKKTAIVSIDTLQNWELNPRSIKEDRYKELKKRITDHGFNDVLKLAADGKTVIGGNMRLRALRDLGFTQVEVLYTEATTPEDILRIALDDNEEFGQYEREALVELAYKLDIPIVELEEYKVHLGPPQSLADIIKEDTEEITEDEPPELSPDPPHSIPGSIYQLGNHRLMCGDATSEDAVTMLLGEQRIDLYLTDPPYNVDYTGKTKDALKIDNDKMDDTEFLSFLSDAFRRADEHLKAGASFYIFHAETEGYNFRAAAKSINWALKSCLVWVKQSMVMGRQDYQWQHEPILYGWKSGASHSWYADRKQTTVMNFDRPNASADHPTMKPVKICAYLIKNSSKAGDLVFDNFLGSGSTLIAAQQLDRVCYGMELDPKYCDVIRKRYWKFINNDNEEGWQDGTPQIT